MKSNIAYSQDVVFTDLGGGARRGVLAHTDDIMVVEVRFEKDGVGAPHSHAHAQSTYVKSGRFEFTIDGETFIIGAGDSIAIEKNAVHATKCIEPGALIDVFAPMRADFL